MCKQNSFWLKNKLTGIKVTQTDQLADTDNRTFLILESLSSWKGDYSIFKAETVMLSISNKSGT